MNAPAANILVVEDEGSIASFVSLYLKNAGYSVRTASNGRDALNQVAQEMPGLIVLDLMLPDIDGIEVTKRIRQTSDVPILMLTARDEDVDKIIGLEVGADDYLTKPFNPRELVARVKSILRRSTPDRRDLESETIDHGDLHVDAGRREVRVGRRGDPARAEGVRPALGAARPPRARAHARPAARARLGLHVRGRHAHGRRARAPAAAQARRRVPDRHGLGRRLQGVAGEGRQEGTGEEVTDMLGSLRVRLPLVFLAGLVLAGLVTTLIAVRLFQDFAHDQALTKLSHEANGIAQLYSNAVNSSYAKRSGKKSSDERAPTKFAAQEPRARDRRPDLLRRPEERVPGQVEHHGAAPAPAAVDDDRLDLRQNGHLRVRAAGSARDVLRRREPDLPVEERHHDRRDRRRDEEDRRRATA